MAELIVSDKQESIQNMNKKIFLHFIKPDFLPIESEFVNINEIDKLDNEGCDLIYMSDVLDYISYNEATSLLDHVFSKLSASGEIIIQSVDLYHLASAIVFDNIDIETSKLILYGNNKKNIFTIYDIQTELANRKIDIVEQKYVNIFEYYIRAKKS